MRSAILLLLLSTLLPVALSKTAVKALSKILNDDDFTCLRSHGYTRFIGWAWSSSFEDSFGHATIEKAHKNGFELVDGVFHVCFKNECTDPVIQMESAITKLAENRAKVDTLWIHVDSFKWSEDLNANRQSLSSMVAKAKSMGQKVGISADKYSFETVFGADYTAQSALPLWWTVADGHADFTSFVPFNGWTVPLYHEYNQVTDVDCGNIPESLTYYA